MYKKNMRTLFERSPLFYSNDGQDCFIYEHFHSIFPKKGCYVDVGAKDGVRTSNTCFFERYLKWEGICIEPNPVSFFPCQENRSSPVLPLAIAKEQKKVDFFCCPIPGLSGIIEKYETEYLDRFCYKNELKNKTSKSIIQVQTMPLQPLLDMFGFTHVNLLDIDTEGGEFEILQTVNYEKIKIDLINVENCFNKHIIRDFLISKGFTLYHSFKCDDLFVHHTF